MLLSEFSVFFQPIFFFDETRCFELIETLISVCSEQMISRDQLVFMIFSHHQKNRIKIDSLLPFTSPFCFLLYQLKIEQKDFFLFVCINLKAQVQKPVACALIQL